MDMLRQSRNGLWARAPRGAKGAAFALLLASAALAAPGMEGKAGPGGPGGPGGRPSGGSPGLEMVHPRLLKELNLSPDQQRKFKEEKLSSQKQGIQYHGEKAMLELDLQNALSTLPVKEADALKLAEKIAEVERKALILRVTTWSHFLAGLSPEQHRKVMEFQADLHEKRKAWRDEMRKGFGKEGKDGKDDGPDKEGRHGERGE